MLTPAVICCKGHLVHYKVYSPQLFPAVKEVNAKAVHLCVVPDEEAWYKTTERSSHNSILLAAGATPAQLAGFLEPVDGLVSIACGTAGAGRVMYVGDVNAETGSCAVVQQMACAMFSRRA
jgi:hypothetical protein